MKFFVTFISLVYVIILNGYAQDIPASSRGNLKFYVDYAGFRGQEGKTYQEFYLMCYVDQFHAIKNDSGQYCVFQVNTLLKNLDDEQAHQKTWTTEVMLPENSVDLRSWVVYDQWTDQIKSGTYQFNVEVKDQNSDQTGSVNFNLFVPEFREDNFDASQIEFVSGVEQNPQDGLFKKGNRKIYPNPARRYGVLNSILYVYYELYNLPKSENTDLIISYSIKDLNNAMVKTFPPKAVVAQENDVSLLHGLDVSKIPSGVYNLVVDVTVPNTNQKESITRSFEVIQLDYAQLPIKFTAEQADSAERLIKYIASPDQYQFYRDLTLESKAQFLINFWRDLDPTPDTIENEYLLKIKQRYSYANRNFTWGKQEGWASDRGRVLIVYGIPDDIDRHHSEAGFLPYEVWQYRKDRYYEFVFADLNTSGNFVLLHSNKDDEVHNYRWLDMLRQM